MILITRLIRWFLSLRPVAWVLRMSRSLVLPGFNGIPIYDVAVFFFRGLTRGYLTSRAAAISFSVFLAIFPFLIFLFNIIPFIPIRDFQVQLLSLIRDLLPESAFETVRETIVDIVMRPRSGLLIFNLALSLYFSTNGVNSLIEAFNNTYHRMETRPGPVQYLVSLVIVLTNSLLLILAVALITLWPALLEPLLPGPLKNSAVIVFLLEVVRWLIILFLLLAAISFLYYLAPAGKKHFRFISAGSVLSTLLGIGTTLGFNFYVDHFSSYNALYGSLGTLMIVLVWIYINAITLIVGFELNASIQSAGKPDLTR